MSVSGDSNDGVIHSDPEDEVANQNLFSDGEAEEENRQGDDEDGTPNVLRPKPKVDPAKKKGPVKRVLLSEDELCGKNGLLKLEEMFKDFEFGKGKGQEKKDLDSMLHKMEHWIHMLHPKHPFSQVLQRIEYLGTKKRAVKTCVKKIRMGLITLDTDDTVPDHNDVADDEDDNSPHMEIPYRSRIPDDDDDDIPNEDDIFVQTEDTPARKSGIISDDDDDLLGQTDTPSRKHGIISDDDDDDLLGRTDTPARKNGIISDDDDLLGQMDLPTEEDIPVRKDLPIQMDLDDESDIRDDDDILDLI